MQKGRRPGRPSPAPPAILRSVNEGYDGAVILDEMRTPSGVVLWQSLHDLVLWASTPPERRGALWGSKAASRRARQLQETTIDDQLRPWLGVLSTVLHSGRTVEVEDVVGACRRISDWAERNSYPKTAIWYAQAAALLSPTVAEHAYTVGAVSRRASDYPRAFTWYTRSIGLALRRADRRTYARAYRGIGQILMQRGAFDMAERSFQRAYQSARRAGVRDVAAEALHDLYTVAVETGRKGEAEELARRAFNVYPSAHPRLAALAHDVAVFWMMQGHHARALPVLHAVLGTGLSLSDRLLAVSGIARAAGGAEDRDAFLSAWVETWEIIDAHPELECVTSSLVRLAYGSASLGDRERVELAAGFALKLALKRGQTPVADEARAILEGVVDVSVEVPVEPEVEQFASRLMTRMRKRARSTAGTGPHRVPCLRC